MAFFETPRFRQQLHVIATTTTTMTKENNLYSKGSQKCLLQYYKQTAERHSRKAIPEILTASCNLTLYKSRDNAIGEARNSIGNMLKDYRVSGSFKYFAFH